MFKDAEKISKAIDNLIKITDGLEKEERRQEMVNVIHNLSCVHQNVLGDLTNKASEKELK